MKLLLVEDDTTLADKLKKALLHLGYVVQLSHDGIDAEFLGLEENYDAT
jgi:two-component system OmpR family response regulator